VLFYPIRDRFDRGGANRSLLAGLRQTGQDLLAIERLAPTVFLDNHREGFFDPLIGCVAALAGETFAAASNNLPFLGHPGIDDLIFDIIAEGTFHLKPQAGDAS